MPPTELLPQSVTAGVTVESSFDGTCTRSMCCLAQVRHLNQAQECIVRLNTPPTLQANPPRPLDIAGTTASALDSKCQDILSKSGDILPGLFVHFASPARYVAEKQMLAIYDGPVCLGGASILKRDAMIMPAI